VAEGRGLEPHAVASTCRGFIYTSAPHLVASPPAQFGITRRGEMAEGTGVEPDAVARIRSLEAPLPSNGTHPLPELQFNDHRTNVK
jgi:hypothetical protein